MGNDDRIQKIGILGGTFNPIHTGHLILAQNAAEICHLDKVLIIPSGCSYFKDPQTVASPEHRVNMTRLAIEGNPLFELSTVETERPGNSYTFETLDILGKEYEKARFYYVIGADTLFSIETWKKPEAIFGACTIVCARRDGLSDDKMQQKAAQLKERFGADIIIMDIPEVEISSTMIREGLGSGMSMRYYLDDKVIAYIRENHLYGV